MDFKDILKPGLSCEKACVVTKKNFASFLGSGSLDIYGTPAMASLMEAAALSAAAPFLPEGWSTVGTELNIKHSSPTPAGMKVICRAELLSADGRELTFKVEAFDEGGKIGEGTHCRFIVEDQKFLKKTLAKNLKDAVS